MSKVAKFARKVLLSQTFFEEGFEYEFLDVVPDEDNYIYNVTVNVKLPKKGQSYVVAVFSNHIHQILSNVWKYIGESFSYSERLLIDGNIPVNGGVFISPEKESEILSTIRREIVRTEIETKKNYLSFDISWKRAKEPFYQLNDVYVDFYFYIELSRFEINGKEVYPSLNLSDEIAGIISDELYDSESFKNEVDETLYFVLQDEINLRNVDDMYLQGRWYIQKIDGFEVSPRYKSNQLSDEMFT